MDRTDPRLALTQAARPALALLPSAAPTRSHLGGLPEVPPGFVWPTWKGRALSFLAQLDLAELTPPPDLAALPREGLLQFFYDPEQSTWGFDPEDRGSWVVLHQPSAGPLLRATPPSGTPAGFVLNELAVRTAARPSYPTLERVGLEGSKLADSEWEALETLRRGGDRAGPRHQLGGWADPVQNDHMELESQLASNGVYLGDDWDDPRIAGLTPGAAEWQLLLQLDSDDELDVMWGDAGMLYFWIRASDLARGDFTQVWMILQCG